MPTKHNRQRNKGEISCRASSNGRECTADSIRDLTLSVPAKQIESSIVCGFRQEHASGLRGKRKFELMTGAGCGSPWLIFQLEGKDYVIHVQDLIEAFFTAIDS